MEVILLEKIANLGKLGDKVNVKPGYARNFLFPKSLAKPATRENMEEFEARRAELEKAEAEKLKAAQAEAAKVHGKSVTIQHMAGEEGKLFGSITTQEIAVAITEAYIEVEKKQIRMNDAIRTVCQEVVEVSFHPDVVAEVTVIVEPEA
jgi:large subunit ribosomal protein L9